jgi:hypothetical protein
MKFIAALFLFLLPFSIFAQDEEEEEEIEKPKKAWETDTSFHKSRLSVKTNLFQQFQFTGADIAVCFPMSKHIYANVDIVGVTDKFLPGKTSRSFPSIAVIGELRYFFPLHSTFDGAFFGPYYRYKQGKKKFVESYPFDFEDTFDVSSHSIGLVAGISFQPRRFPHLVIEAHTGMGVAVELDIIREDPRLPTIERDPRRASLNVNEKFNPRAGFCIGYAF